MNYSRFVDKFVNDTSQVFIVFFIIKFNINYTAIVSQNAASPKKYKNEKKK